MGMAVPIYATERSRFLAKWAWALMGKDVLAPPPSIELVLEISLEISLEIRE